LYSKEGFMTFTLEVGDKEKSQLTFSRSSWTGAMRTLVDGRTVARQSPFSPFTHFSLKLKRRFEFVAGKTEKHNVILEKDRPFLFAGFRSQIFRVFVDGKLVHEQIGY
jgi:hypothetical protein